MRDHEGHQTVNYYIAVLDAALCLESFYTEIGVLGAYDQIESTRKAIVPGYTPLTSPLTSTNQMWQVTPHIGCGFFYWGGEYSLEPFLLVDWVCNFENRIVEHGAGVMDMQINSWNSSLLRSEAGFNLYREWRTVSSFLFLLKMNAAYVNKIPFGIGHMTAYLIPAGGSFQVDSFTDCENLWTAGLELLCRENYSGWFGAVEYRGEFGSGYFFPCQFSQSF